MTEEADFGDADAEDAYDAEEAPAQRLAVLRRWVDRADEERDHSALLEALSQLDRDLPDPRVLAVLAELAGLRLRVQNLLAGLP